MNYFETHGPWKSRLPGGPHFAKAHGEHVGRTGCAGQECPGPDTTWPLGQKAKSRIHEFLSHAKCIGNRER